MLADAAVHGGHQLRDPDRPGQVLTGPARPQLLRAAASSGAMAPDRTGPVRHLLAQVVLRRSGVPEPRPAAVHRHERALHHLLGHPGVPDHHRGLPHQRLVMRQVQPGDRTIGAPAAARRHPASPPGRPAGQGPGHARRTHRVIYGPAPRRAIRAPRHGQAQLLLGQQAQINLRPVAIHLPSVPRPGPQTTGRARLRSPPRGAASANMPGPRTVR